MDQCLRLQEIIQLIFDEAEGSSALALSLTCKGFLDAGLDSLWREITSFEPLVACLPGDSFTRQALNESGAVKYEIRRPPSTADLDRYLNFYANRIRRLSFDNPKRIAVLSIPALITLELAAGRVPGVLSPKLQSFQWFSKHQLTDIVDNNFFGIMAQSMYLFLGESVTSMTVDGTGTSAPPFSTSICLYAKHLVHLEKLAYRGTRGGLDDFLSASGWNNLRSVEVEEISADGLRRLAPLPSLSSLTVSARGNDERKYQKAFHRHATIPYGFQSLRALKIQAAHFEYLRTFLQYLPPYNTLQSIEFLTRFASPTPEKSCQDALLAVAQYANSKTLMHLHVGDATCFKSIPSENTSPRKKVQDLVDISVLYDFKALKALTVHCEAEVGVTPKVISSIAEAWPNIETLDLCTTLSLPLPPSIDHTHLLEILGGCPSLRHLGLRFDATKLTDMNVGTPRPVYVNLRKLSVGESPVCSPELVKGFIEAHFPNLEALDMCYARATSEELETDPEAIEPGVHQSDDIWDGIRESLGLGFDSDRLGHT